MERRGEELLRTHPPRGPDGSAPQRVVKVTPMKAVPPAAAMGAHARAVAPTAPTATEPQTEVPEEAVQASYRVNKRSFVLWAIILLAICFAAYLRDRFFR